MANLFYRNTNAKIAFEVLDTNNNYVGLSNTSTIYYYIKTPDNFILSNDTNVINTNYPNGIGSIISNPVMNDTIGVYYINYTLSKIGEYKYKFQVNDTVNGINLAVSGDIKVISDGIF